MRKRCSQAARETCGKSGWLGLQQLAHGKATAQATGGSPGRSNDQKGKNQPTSLPSPASCARAAPTDSIIGKPPLCTFCPDLPMAPAPTARLLPRFVSRPCLLPFLQLCAEYFVLLPNWGGGHLRSHCENRRFNRPDQAALPAQPTAEFGTTCTCPLVLVRRNLYVRYCGLALSTFQALYSYDFTASFALRLFLPFSTSLASTHIPPLAPSSTTTAHGLLS